MGIKRGVLLSLILIFFSLGLYSLLAERENLSPSSVAAKTAYAGDHKLKKALSIEDTVPVAIIGAGAAGLSAGLWTSRAKFKTLLFTGPKPGGQLTEVRSIENWPGRSKSSGLKAIDELREQAEHFGTQIVYDTISKVDLTSWPFTLMTEKGATVHCLSLIVATGGTPKRSNVPGVQTYWGRGVGTCSICDAPFTKGKKVIIIGGGDTAGDRALQFAAYAKKVIMVVRESELEACATVQEYLEENPKISFLFNTEIEEIKGDGRKVTGVKARNNKTGELKKIPIDGVYFAIGFKPNSEVVSSQLETDEKGFIKRKDCSQNTSVEGVFVAGDVDDNPHRKAAVAVGNGVEAALDAIDFLQDNGFTPDSTKQLKYPSFVTPDEVDIETVSTIAELRSVLANEKNPVLVDFYADYCSMCRALMPALQTLASEYEGKLKVVKVERNEKSMGLFDYFSITSVPYYIMFKKSRERDRSAVVATPKDLEDFVKKFMANEG